MPKFKDVIKKLDPQDYYILKYLMMHRGLYVSTNSVARKFKIDPRTAKKHLRILELKQLIKRKVEKKKKFTAKTKDGRTISGDIKRIRWSFKPGEDIRP